jgi:hypothetical protein
MALKDIMSNVVKMLRPGTCDVQAQCHALEAFEPLTAPQLESNTYEFMLENLMDLPSDNFDRWRNRMPQG